MCVCDRMRGIGIPTCRNGGWEVITQRSANLPAAEAAQTATSPPSPPRSPSCPLSHVSSICVCALHPTPCGCGRWRRGADDAGPHQASTAAGVRRTARSPAPVGRLTPLSESRYVGLVSDCFLPIDSPKMPCSDCGEDDPNGSLTTARAANRNQSVSRRSRVGWTMMRHAESSATPAGFLRAMRRPELSP